MKAMKYKILAHTEDCDIVTKGPSLEVPTLLPGIQWRAGEVNSYTAKIATPCTCGGMFLDFQLLPPFSMNIVSSPDMDQVPAARKLWVASGVQGVWVYAYAKATGLQIKQGAIDRGLRASTSWQLQGRNANGTNTVIGDDAVPWQTEFDLLDVGDNA